MKVMLRATVLLLALCSVGAEATVRFAKSPTGSTLWTGLSSDTKPDTSNGISGTTPSANDLFLETDTQNQFIYVGNAWTAYKPVNSSVSISGVVQTNGAPSSQTNASGTITVGSTFQTIAALSATRKSFEFQNICSKSGNCTALTNNCYLFVGASGSPSISNSILVPAGASYLRSSGAIPTDAIKATCDGTSDAYYLSTQ